MEPPSTQPSQIPGQSSEEEHPYPNIESEEFRCGFNKPLPMEPIRLAAIWGERRVNVWRNCTEQAVTICKGKDLEVSEIGTYMICGAYSESFAPTILISVKNDTQKALWKPILINISRVLLEEDCQELHALISCTSVLEIPEMHIFPVEPKNLLVNLWPELMLKNVLWILRWHHLYFDSVEVFYLGETRDQSLLKILITTRNIEQVNWNKAKAEVESYCVAKGFPLGVVIERGRIAITRASPTLTGGFVERGYIQSVPMGTSVGVLAKGEGSLGGYIQLRDRQSGAVQVFAMTNYHVVRGDDLKWPASIDQKHSEWPKGLGVVQCPSQGDHQAEIKQLLEDIPREEEQVETHPLTYKVKYGEVNQAQREGYAALVHPLEQMRARLAFCQNTDRDGLKFGDVAFSSGFRIAEGNHALDWAIIDVQTSRLGQNTLPEARDVAPFPLNVHLPHRFIEWHQSTRKFFKRGRASGLTTGLYSHIKSHVELDLFPNDDPLTPTKRMTDEHVIVAPRGSSQFSELGDSGAWIITSIGEVTGMIWGAGPRGQCYFTPIGLIIKDIEKATGKEVILYK